MANYEPASACLLRLVEASVAVDPGRSLNTKFTSRFQIAPISATMWRLNRWTHLETVKAASDIGAESLTLQTMIPAIGTKNGEYSNYCALVSLTKSMQSGRIAAK
jgi:hypothetical protein